MALKLFHIQLVGTVYKKFVYCLVNNRVLKVRRQLIKRNQYKPPVWDLWMGNGQLFFMDDFFIKKQNIYIYDTGRIFNRAYPAHFLFDRQNNLHGLLSR